MRTSEPAEESVPTCTSSAPFPGLTSDLLPKDEALHDDDSQAGGQYGDGDTARLSDEMASPFPPHLAQAHPRDVATEMQSPVSMNFASSDHLSFDFAPLAKTTTRSRNRAVSRAAQSMALPATNSTIRISNTRRTNTSV